MLTQSRSVFEFPARLEEHFQHHLVVNKFIQTKECRKYHTWFNILLEVLNSKKQYYLMFIALLLLVSFYCDDPKKSQHSDAADFHSYLYDTQHFRQDCVPVSNLEQNLFLPKNDWKADQGNRGTWFITIVL